MGGACLGIQYLPIYPDGQGKLVWGIQLFMLIGTGGIVYFAACHLMGLGTIRPFSRQAPPHSPANIE
jgi:hypothetical protein